MADEKHSTAEQIEKYVKNPGKGMILDGVIASEAIDTSGEILRIQGCDISSLTTDGVLNTEHRGDDAAGYSFNDVIGRCIYAKKIFGLKDCENDRERMYWRQVELPFIYGKFRLFDGAGHPGAIAAAASIRDMLHAGEDILVRFSIEGSTLQRDPKNKNILERSVARRVAATWKPCNRSANSGVLADPNGPPMPSETKKSEHEHPGYMRLGGEHEFKGSPVFEDMDKAYTAGNADAAPGTLTGGAALQRQDLVRRTLNGARAALRDWDRQEPIRAFLKHRLPEADPAFIDRFADMVDNFSLKKREETKAPPPPPPAKPASKKKPQKKPAAPVFSKEFEPRDQPADSKKVKFPDAAPPLPAPGVAPRTSAHGKVHLDANAVLHTSKGDFQQSFPTEEYQGPESAAIYRAILNPHAEESQKWLNGGEDNVEDTVHAPWRRAMDHWTGLNKMLRDGKLPESVVWHAALFAAMSPNTPVPLQELYYGYAMDLANKLGMDPTHKVSRSMLVRLRQGISSGMQPPEFEREHYLKQQGVMRSAADDQDAQDEAEGDFSHAGRSDVLVGAGGQRLTHLDRPQKELIHEEKRWPDGAQDIRAHDPQQLYGVVDYHKWHPHLMELVRHHRDNGREIASMLMRMKSQHEPGESKFPTPYAFGPKLARYMLGMLGAGNSLVADRHMIRSMFNLRLGTGQRGQPGTDPGDRDTIAHLTRVLSQAQNHHILEAMDHHFFTKHPAVKHVISQYPEHFQGHEEQAIFPAFWLHWLTIPHHERLRKMPHLGFNGGTDHYPFWASIRDVLGRHEIAHDDDSFDFGSNLGKGEDLPLHKTLPYRTALAMHEIAAKHGETAATYAFYAHLLPALLSAEQADHHWSPGQETSSGPEKAEEVVRKFEAMSVVLHHSMEGLRKAEAPTEITVDGRKVVNPGEALWGGQQFGRKHYLVHQDHDYVYALPADQGPTAFSMAHVQKWPKHWEGNHFHIVKPMPQPATPVVDSTVHTIPEYTVSPAQHALVHGMQWQNDASAEPGDYRPGVTENARWMMGGNGKPAFVKPTNDRESARREVLYHNLAHQFFGLGGYVPTTTLVKHPTTGRLHSIQEGVNAAEHPDGEHISVPLSPNIYSRTVEHAAHRDMLTGLGQAGELDKLTLMNWIMGNHDRHANNWLYTDNAAGETLATKPELKLIDHGNTLGVAGGWPVPHYLEAFHMIEDPHAYTKTDAIERPLHPAAAEWAKKLDPEALKNHFQRHHAFEQFGVIPHQRLTELRRVLDTGPAPSLKALRLLMVPPDLLNRNRPLSGSPASSVAPMASSLPSRSFSPVDPWSTDAEAS